MNKRMGMVTAAFVILLLAGTFAVTHLHSQKSPEVISRLLSMSSSTRKEAGDVPCTTDVQCEQRDEAAHVPQELKSFTCADFAELPDYLQVNSPFHCPEANIVSLDDFLASRADQDGGFLSNADYKYIRSIYSAAKAVQGYQALRAEYKKTIELFAEAPSQCYENPQQDQAAYVRAEEDWLVRRTEDCQLVHDVSRHRTGTMYSSYNDSLDCVANLTQERAQFLKNINEIILESFCNPDALHPTSS